MMLKKTEPRPYFNKARRYMLAAGIFVAVLMAAGVFVYFLNSMSSAPPMFNLLWVVVFTVVLASVTAYIAGMLINRVNQSARPS